MTHSRDAVALLLSLVELRHDALLLVLHLSHLFSHLQVSLTLRAFPHHLLALSKGVNVGAQTGTLALGLLELVIHRGECRNVALLLAAQRLKLLALVHNKQVCLGTEPAVLGKVGVGQSASSSLALLALLLCRLDSTPTRDSPLASSIFCRMAAPPALRVATLSAWRFWSVWTRSTNAACDLAFLSECSISVSTLTRSGFLSSTAFLAFLRAPSRFLTLSCAVEYSWRALVRASPFSVCCQHRAKV